LNETIKNAIRNTVLWRKLRCETDLEICRALASFLPGKVTAVRLDHDGSVVLELRV